MDGNPKKYKKWLDATAENAGAVPRSTLYRWMLNQSRAEQFDGQLQNDAEDVNVTLGAEENQTISDVSSNNSEIINQNEENEVQMDADAAEDIQLPNFDQLNIENENEPPFLINNDEPYEDDDDANIDGNNGEDNYNHLKAVLDDPDFMEPPTQAVNKSKGEILMMIVRYVLKHNPSHIAVSDLFMFVNNLFESPVFEETRYHLDKLFNPQGNINFHAVCPQCDSYAGSFLRTESINLQCPNCLTIIDRKSIIGKNFFITLEISKSVSNLIQSHDAYYDQLIHNIDLTDRTNITIKDIHDGKQYRDFVKSLSPEDRYAYATAIFNSDGVPLFSGSNCSIWPIQLVINEIPPQDRLDSPVLYGLWFGKDKPNMNVFFTPFVEDMNSYSTTGIDCKILDENRTIKLFPICCCVDSVARAPMQGHVQFNGYYGCNWCVHPGEYVLNAVKYTLQFPEPEMRSDNTTIQEMQTAVETKKPVRGVKTATRLINLLYFNVIFGFVVDYMHCILLGVARQFAEYWFATTIFMSKDDIDLLSKKLMKMKPPRQICRLTRPISERKYWKAREWENWILFYSIPLLQMVLEQKYLSHWALLVESLYILMGDNITYEKLLSAELLLCEFVCKTQLLYGKTAMTFNVHLLSHLTNTVANWGPLWACNAFPFESENGKLIRLIKSAKGIPYQICRQISFEQATELIIRKVKCNCTPSVLEFSHKLDRRVTKCFTFKNVQYLNPSNLIELNIRLRDQFVTNARVYTKIIRNGSIYQSYNSKRCDRRSDDSFALLTDGSYVQIKAFLINDESNNAFAVVETLQLKLNADNGLCNDYLKEFEEQNNGDELLISVENIMKTCVFINLEYKSYVIAVCNSYRY